MKSNLSNKTVLVTGAAGLLGMEHCKALALVGANVIMTDINSSILKQSFEEVRSLADGSINYYTLDVTNYAEAQELNAELIRNGIIVNVLINNAAIDHKVSKDNSKFEATRLEVFNPADFMNEVNVGLTGAIICASVFGQHMAKNEDGIIVNVASDLSVIAPDQRLYQKADVPEEMQGVKPVSYSVIKHGIHGLTKYLASYWGHCNVRTNTLSPSGIATENMPSEFRDKLKNLNPQGRIAKKDEYHGAIVYLCSDASTFMNGQNIIIDGGRSII